MNANKLTAGQREINRRVAMYAAMVESSELSADDGEGMDGGIINYLPPSHKKRHAETRIEQMERQAYARVSRDSGRLASESSYWFNLDETIERMRSAKRLQAIRQQWQAIKASMPRLDLDATSFARDDMGRLVEM